MDSNKGTEENPLTPDSEDKGATVPSVNQEQTAPSGASDNIDSQLLQELSGLRQSATDDLSTIKEMLPHVPSPIIAEVIIAKRAIEDARMRLGVAMTLVQGGDPWNSQAPQLSR